MYITYSVLRTYSVHHRHASSLAVSLTAPFAAYINRRYQSQHTADAPAQRRHCLAVDRGSRRPSTFCESTRTG